MKITKKDSQMFSYAATEAEFSDFHNFHTGCVIVYKGVIIGRGHNTDRTHPKQKKYNRKYRDFNPGTIKDSLHAEMSALISIPKSVSKTINWSKVKVYVYRLCPGRDLGFGNARPCPACMAALKDKNIQHIYYTTNEGYAYEQIRS